MKNIGLMVKIARKNKCLTQEELAERTGISVSQISRLERNQQKNPKLNTIEKLREVLTNSEI